jgi:hypothetical protein
MSTPIADRQLAPLPFQQAMVDYFRREEADLWKWFRDERATEQARDAVRMDLLKTAYRIERGSQSGLYESADETAKRLSLDVPITIYQAQNAVGLNAALAYIPGEAHVVFCGPILDNLDQHELRALLGHELAHFALWEAAGGDYLIADQILAAMTADRRAEPVHLNTARRCALYGEIFCDRGALLAGRDLGAAVSMLVKVETGLKQVSSQDYLRQADEIFAGGEIKTDGVTHPEAFLRARALQRWAEDPASADGEVQRMIEGPLSLDDADLLNQQRIAALTRQLIDALIAPSWFHSDAVLAHARMFFSDYTPATGGGDGAAQDSGELKAAVADSGAELADYFCYVMLDFVTADRQLEEAPLAAAVELGRQLGWHERFAEIAQKELRMRKKQFELVVENMAQILRQAAEESHAKARRREEKAGEQKA